MTTSSRAPIDAGFFVSALFVLSGAAALIYQVAFVRAFVELYGSTSGALGAVVGAFLLCLTVGALVASRVADRVARPLRLYALLEAVAALGGVLAWWGVSHLEPIAVSLARQSLDGNAMTLARFGVALGVLVVPIGALGATLPVLARVRAHRGRAVAAGGLQAANTLGAVAGVLLASSLLLPSLGLQLTLLTAAGVNLVIAALAAMASRWFGAAAPAPAPGGVEAPAAPYLVTALASGAFLVALEVVALRGMAQSVRGGVESVGVFLACVLLAQAMGTTLGVALVRAVHAYAAIVVGFLGSAAGALWALWRLYGTMDEGAPYAGGQLALSWSGRLAGEAGATLLTFGPAMLAAGISFPGVCQLRPRGGMPFGRWVAWQAGLWSLGAAVAGLCAHGVLLPMGLRQGLLVCAAVPLLALAVASVLDRRLWSRGRLVAGGAFAVVLAFLALGDVSRGSADDSERATIWSRPLQFYGGGMSPGSVLVQYHEGAMANVAVVADPRFGPALKVNNQLSLGGSGSQQIEGMQALIPTLLHPRPQRGLALGVGAGITVGTMIQAGIQQVDAVELIPEVMEVLPEFRFQHGGVVQIVRDGRRWQHPGLRLFEGDAREFVRGAESNTYDVIVGDLFFPWQSEAGFLYTREHFTRVKELLAPEGLFCQWLPGHQMGWEEIGVVGRTFAEVFEGATIWLARVDTPFPIVGLLAGKENLRIHVPTLEERFDTFPNPDLLEQYDVRDVPSFLGLYVADEFLFRNRLVFERFEAINTTDRPVVEFETARRRESEGVIALNNRSRLYEVREDVVGRMSTMGLEQTERRRIQDELALASKVMGERFRAATLRNHADANRLMAPADRLNDPAALEREAFEVLHRAYHANPADDFVRDDLRDLLRRQLELGAHRRVVEGVTSLATLQEGRDDPALRSLRGQALLWLAYLPPTPREEPTTELQFELSRLLDVPLRSAESDFLAALDRDSLHLESRMFLGIVQFLNERDEAARSTFESVKEQMVETSGKPDAVPLLPAVPEAIHTFLAGDSQRALRILATEPGLPYVRALAQRMLPPLEEQENGQP